MREQTNPESSIRAGGGFRSQRSTASTRAAWSGFMPRLYPRGHEEGKTEPAGSGQAEFPRPAAAGCPPGERNRP